MKKIVQFVLIVAFFIFSTGCIEKNDFQKVSENISNYKIDIQMQCDSKILQANQSVDYINNSDQVLDQVYFHLYPNAFKEQGCVQAPVSEYNFEKAYPNGFDAGYIDIKKVKIKSQDTNYEEKGDEKNILVVNLNFKLRPQESIQIDIQYDVKIPNIIHRFGYGDHTINVGNFYPIACVFENGEWKQEGYHYNGDPFYSDMANYEVNISYDKRYMLASTGECKTLEQNDKKVSTCKAKVVRDFAFVLSDQFKTAQDEQNGTKLTYMYYDDQDVQTSMKCIKDCLNTFEGIIGDYPYSTLTVVQSNFLHGGMEYPNLVLISDAIESQNDYLSVIVHEIAHQWFYNLIGNDEYSEAWLDEGLTEYVTVLFFDINKEYDVSYTEMVSGMLSSYQLFVEIYSEVFGELDTSMTRSLDEYNSEPEYTYCVYIKGVLMLDHLRDIVGETAFYVGLKNYYKENVYKVAKQENFISAFQKASNKDISGIIKSWLNGTVVLQKVQNK